MCVSLNSVIVAAMWPALNIPLPWLSPQEEANDGRAPKSEDERVFDRSRSLSVLRDGILTIEWPDSERRRAEDRNAASHRSIDSDFDPRTWEEAEDAGLGLPLKRGMLSAAKCYGGAGVPTDRSTLTWQLRRVVLYDSGMLTHELVPDAGPSSALTSQATSEHDFSALLDRFRKADPSGAGLTYASLEKVVGEQGLAALEGALPHARHEGTTLITMAEFMRIAVSLALPQPAPATTTLTVGRGVIRLDDLLSLCLDDGKGGQPSLVLELTRLRTHLLRGDDLEGWQTAIEEQIARRRRPSLAPSYHA